MKTPDEAVERYDYFMNKLTKTMFDKIEKGKKNEIIQKARLYLNDLIKQINLWSRKDKEVEKEYMKKYNNIAEKLNPSIEIRRISNDDKEAIMGLKEDMTDSILEASKLSEQSLEQKVEYFDKYIKATNLGTAFSPRVVLFQVGKFWTESEKNAIRKTYLKTTREIKKEIKKMREGKQTYNQASKEVTKTLEEVYPTGKVPIPRRVVDKKTGKEKLVTTHMDLTHYTDAWVKDMSTLNDSKAVVSATLDSGFDLIQVGGGITDNPLCDPFSKPPAIYSITGKSKKYKRLTKYPPYHPNCSKYLKPLPKSKQEEIKKEEKPKKKVEEEKVEKEKKIITPKEALEIETMLKNYKKLKEDFAKKSKSAFSTAIGQTEKREMEALKFELEKYKKNKGKIPPEKEQMASLVGGDPFESEYYKISDLASTYKMSREDIIKAFVGDIKEFLKE